MLFVVVRKRPAIARRSLSDFASNAETPASLTCSKIGQSCAYFRAGTPLRGVFKSARLRLDDASAELRSMNVAREKNMTERMEEIMKKRKAQFEQFDQSGSEDVHQVGIVGGRGGRGPGSEDSRSATMFSCAGAWLTRRHVCFLCSERDFALFVSVLLSHLPQHCVRASRFHLHRIKGLQRCCCCCAFCV